MAAGDYHIYAPSAEGGQPLCGETVRVFEDEEVELTLAVCAECVAIDQPPEEEE